MSYHPAWASRGPLPTYPSFASTPDFERKVALAAILLLFGAVGLSLLDSWPSTTKRLVWEALVFLTPARLVYVIEYAMVHYKWLPGKDSKFRPEHFGDRRAKAEAIQRILRLDNSQFTTPLQRVRAFSGINKIIGRPHPSHPSGLGNWDNSCYQNSVLQGLASLPTFRTFINRSLERMGELDDAPTHCSLQEIVGRLNAAENQGGTLWTPSALKSMDSWQQQDAQEYFSKLMDTVDKEISKTVKRTELGSGFDAAAATPRGTNETTLSLPNPLEGLLAQRVACKQCGHAEGLSLLLFNCLTINMGRQDEYDLEELLDEHTALEDIDGVECVKCTLLYARSQLEQFLAKSAASGIPDESTDAAKIRDITEARLAGIQKVFDDDSFSEASTLKRCNIQAKNKVSSVKSKQVALARPPKILVIHINRSIFDDFGNQRKNTASIRFPPAFNLGRWCLGVKSSSADIEEFEYWPMVSTKSILPFSKDELLNVPSSYELRCVVTHHGRHENGHYVAYGKRQPRSSEVTDGSEPVKGDALVDQWYCFNDEIVRPVSEDDVLDRGNVFMLFYEAVERPPLLEHSNVEADEAVVVAPMKTAVSNDVECTEELSLKGENGVQEDTLDNVGEGKGSEVSLEEAPTSALDCGEKDVTPEKAPISVSGNSRIDKSPTGSGLTPTMRTSSASPVLSRMERPGSSFAVPSSSIISAI